tara:strand:- start:417 stop:590 length:174 start_codon:yes stop_codon:yes gene_type:complete
MAVQLENWEIAELKRSKDRAKLKIKRLRELTGNDVECNAKEEDEMHRQFILQAGVMS